MEKPMLVLCSDLDNTLVSNDKDNATYAKEFNRTWKKIKETRKTCLIYNTGRSLVDFKQNQIFRSLLLPDYVVVANGSEIYKIENGQFVLDKTWDAFLGESFNKNDVLKLMNRYDECINSVFAEKILTDRKRHSITLSDQQDPQHVFKTLKRKLPQCLWILETDVHWLDHAAFIDCMPANCTKGSALDYLANVIQSGCDFHADLDIIWAGDEYNDISFTITEFKGIIVGNASQRLVEKARPGSHYIAKEKYARGVIEGLRHFGHIEDSWLARAMPYLMIAGVAAVSYASIRILRSSVLQRKSAK